MNDLVIQDENKEVILSPEIIKKRGPKRKPIINRLMALTNKDESGCWLWIGALDSNGYGRVNYGGHAKSGLAHRVMYLTIKGQIINNLPLDHLCRNHKCVNPNHLEPVTHKENACRGLTGKYQSMRTHCTKGHPYNEINTYWRKNGRGRTCRRCSLESVWKHRRKEIPND